MIDTQEQPTTSEARLAELRNATGWRWLRPSERTELANLEHQEQRAAMESDRIEKRRRLFAEIAQRRQRLARCAEAEQAWLTARAALDTFSGDEVERAELSQAEYRAKNDFRRAASAVPHAVESLRDDEQLIDTAPAPLRERFELDKAATIFWQNRLSSLEGGVAREGEVEEARQCLERESANYQQSRLRCIEE